MLDLLDGAGMRATFFVIGRRARAHPELAAEIARRGHRVENHTDTHPHLFACYPAGPCGGRSSAPRARSRRRPAGAPGSSAPRPACATRSSTGCSTAPASASSPGPGAASTPSRRAPAAIARRLLAGLAPGDILLLHDGRATVRPAGNPVVLEVLPRLLDALAARGLRSVPVPDPPAAERLR